MRIEPPKRHLSKLVGLFVAGDGPPVVMGEWGTTTLEQAPSCAIIYAHRSKDTYALVRQGRGRARRWKHNIVGYEIDGRKIRNLRGFLDKYSPAEAFGILVAWADWIRERGGNPGTFSGSAWSMLRASLDRPVFLREPHFDTRALPIGARVEKSVDRGRFDFVSRWDISGAYPHSMMTMITPRRYVETPNASIDDEGFALADVKIPTALPWGPLPYRTRNGQIFPIGGGISGVWHIRELRAARDSGCEVIIRRAWIGRGRVSLFGEEWARTMTTGRSLPGEVGTLAKVTLNSLWGSFAISGAGEWWSFPNGTGFVREQDAREVRPRSLSFAASVASRVRERLYREALSTDVFILGCHTDGLITELDVKFTPSNGLLGDWRKQDSGLCIDFLGPQMYRILGTDGWHYVVSGMSQETAPRAFKFFLRNDEELRHIERREAVEAYRARARARWGSVVA